MKPGQLVTNSQEETEDFGRQLGQSLRIPALILLEGSLGAGKTALTRGIVDGLGCDDLSVVHSPTFSLVNEYPCFVGAVYHIDLYRLETLRDLYSIGLDELVTAEAVVIVEWAEKLLFKVEYTWKITFEVTGESSRRISIGDCG